MWFFRVLIIFSSLIVAGGAHAASIAPAPACEAVETGLLEEDKHLWSACEKWVWSCIREGKEANLYVRRCLAPRSMENAQLRAKLENEAIEDPHRYAETNALGETYLPKLLWQQHYTSQIPPTGIRIFGGYFNEPVNLENVTTSKNIVLDGSVFMNGLRLSNFQTEKNVSLDGSNVRGNLILLRARIDGSLFMNRGVFDRVDLRDARIGASFEGSRSVFNDEIRMDRASIHGKVYLIKSRITALYAWDAFIGGSLEARLADFRLGLDMTGATVNGDVRLQRVIFGELSGLPAIACAWDRSRRVDDLLGNVLDGNAGDEAKRLRVIDEVAGSRPALLARRLCANDVTMLASDAHKDVLLRDMKIKGTLCLFDLSGEIKTPTSRDGQTAQASGHIETISLDGTQANSTILKWTKSPSQTLWRAVNFKTSYMLINLDHQPARHYIDNLDIGFIAFLRGEPKVSNSVTGDDDKFLCDVTPADTTTETLLANSRDAHERIVRFFTGSANEARSAQPFAKIAERLEDSGASSTYLKTKLSEYRMSKLCTTSAFSKELVEIRGVTLLNLPSKVGEIYRNARARGEIRDPGETPHDVIVEANRLVWDGVCQVGKLVYASTVSYGHEPYNLFFYILFFIALFWLLLRFDSPEAPPGRDRQRPQLGLVYVVDTFMPLPQMKLDRESAGLLPNRPSLRLYLKFHRVVGLLFAVLVFLFIYRAAK